MTDQTSRSAPESRVNVSNPAEIAALQAIADALKPLTEEESSRILSWAFARFVEDPATARAEALIRERDARIEAAREARRAARERRASRDSQGYPLFPPAASPVPQEQP